MVCTCTGIPGSCDATVASARPPTTPDPRARPLRSVHVYIAACQWPGIGAVLPPLPSTLFPRSSFCARGPGLQAMGFARARVAGETPTNATAPPWLRLHRPSAPPSPHPCPKLPLPRSTPSARIYSCPQPLLTPADAWRGQTWFSTQVRIGWMDAGTTYEARPFTGPCHESLVDRRGGRGCDGVCVCRMTSLDLTTRSGDIGNPAPSSSIGLWEPATALPQSSGCPYRCIIG